MHRGRVCPRLSHHCSVETDTFATFVYLPLLLTTLTFHTRLVTTLRLTRSLVLRYYPYAVSI